MSLNSVCIMGRLTRDPELRHTPGGTAVVSFSLAVDRDRKDENGDRAADFFDVVAWSNTAEFVSKYFSKGKAAVVRGRLQARTWQDKEGNNRKTVEIVADAVYFGESARNDNGAGQGYAPSGYANTGENNANTGGFSVMPDGDGEELPF